MREAIEGERALGTQDRGLLGGFAAALLRRVKADAASLGDAHAWAMAALTSYRLKDRRERDEVCLRLVPHFISTLRPDGDASLDTPVETLPGVGAKTAGRLGSLGLRTLGDLLDHFPRTYIDRRELVTIANLRVGQEATVIATVREAKTERKGPKRSLTTITISDGTGYLRCKWWNQDYRARALPEGTEAAWSGTVKRGFQGRLELDKPVYDLLSSSGEAIHTGRIVPIYPATEGLSATSIRRFLHTAFERLGRVPDPLPARVRVSRNLLSKDVASRLIHFPDDLTQIPDARRRLVFEELYVLQVGLALRKRHMDEDLRGIVHRSDGELVGRFLGSIPFRPTGAQRRAMDEIGADMARPRPMHRLLQGEVGSGKTLVAVHAAMVAVASGTQAAIMAPTEVLAEQHARKIRELTEPLGIGVELLTNAVPQARRRDILTRLGAGDLPLVCGTHALISEGVTFKRLGLAVVDEQHRFGLHQRVLLREKGEDPDVLIMTATPIPRTLALTLYGDLDVSILDELPSGRQPIETHVWPDDDVHRERGYDIVRNAVAKQQRAFVVCPLVDESNATEARAAVAEAERLRTEVFPDLAVGLLHGQMRPAEKDDVMERFRTGEVSVLIATTVVEVGVDVPEATVMLIENAERFGLSQLHQLRGRIGRGEHGGVCVLFSDAQTEEARQRLDAIASTTDGFTLADKDLQIRGEGTIFGTRQAGVGDLKVARLVEDFPVLVEAREAAFETVAADPKLERPEHALVRAEVWRRFGDDLHWLFKG